MFNYCVNDNGDLEIYFDNNILCEISECGDMSEEDLKELVDTVIEEEGYNELYK